MDPLFSFSISRLLFKKCNEFLFLNDLLFGGKCSPISPDLKAPNMESVIA